MLRFNMILHANEIVIVFDEPMKWLSFDADGFREFTRLLLEQAEKLFPPVTRQ